MREIDVIDSGRRALADNKTVVYENNPFTTKEMRRDNDRTALIKGVRRAVMTANKYLSICQILTSENGLYRPNYGCVAGPHHGFEFSMSKKMSRSFIAIKLNELFIILFRDRFSKIIS